MKLAILLTLIIVLTSSCSHTKPDHTFNIGKCGDKVCMPKEDFNLFYDAYLEYYGIKKVGDN